MQDTREQTAPTGVRADAIRTAIVDRSIAIDFGRGQPDPAPGEALVALSNRILLDPPTCARLISALQEIARRHGGAWPAADAEPVAQASRAPTRSHAEPDEAGSRAALMIRLMAALDCPYYQERSFRISTQSIAANRFLLTANTKSISGDRHQAILEMCQRLSMPADLQEQAAELIGGAKAVHFGFEGDGRILYKVYLERRDAFEESRNAAPGTPVLLHVAFKWDTSAPAQRAISRYRWYPHLSVAQVVERMAAIYRGDHASPSLRIAREVLQAAAAGMNEKSLQYLEVQEDGNERLSFDLNVYDAGLQLKDIQPQLTQMRETFGIRPGQFQALYDQIKTRILGHLAGGVHRNGLEFFNVYYGAQRYRG